MTTFLQLSPNSEIVKAFQMFGTVDSLPEELLPVLEKFTCAVYSSKSVCVMLPVLRWVLFKVKNLEGEKLLPTRVALKPHVQRANFMSIRDKSYKELSQRT